MRSSAQPEFAEMIPSICRGRLHLSTGDQEKLEDVSRNQDLNPYTGRQLAVSGLLRISLAPTDFVGTNLTKLVVISNFTTETEPGGQ